MKKYLHIALMLLCVLAVTSCKDDNDDTAAVEQEAYKLEQEALFQAKAGDTNYVKWNSEANDGFVFAKLIKKGDGEQAYFNSRVSVYYKGSLTDGTVFSQWLFNEGDPSTYAVYSTYAGTVKDPVTGVSTTYGSVITGWTVALQHMVVGDKYEVWIPQQLAYGATGKDNILPYSTLIFEIELVAVDQQAVSAGS